MNKRIPFFLAITTILTLTSCNSSSTVVTSSNPQTSSSTPISSSTSRNDDVYVKPDPVLAPDSELIKYDDIPFYYDNKMEMESIGSKEVPDPFVYRFNGTYYLYPTTTQGRVKAYKSQDMLFWEPVANGILSRGYVYDATKDASGAIDPTTVPFAPEVIYYNGYFYMIASPSGNGHYIMKSDSPEGPFECVTGNIGRSIDGSFFIDSDEQVYLYGADGSGIKVYGLENDLTTFRKNDNGSLIDLTLSNLRVGNWNEGPYILQKDGQYYATYCGTHYLSKSYRVDYAYAPAGADLLSQKSYTREDNIIVSTTDSFNGLGHSATVLAPDLDSYYIVYHNLGAGNNRYLNYSRLSFNGSKMAVNQINETNNIGIDMPNFYSYEGEYFDEIDGKLLSSNKSGEDFTVEFNTIGEGKMFFSYIDKDNYSYIEFKNNEIGIDKVSKGVAKEVHNIPLINEYFTDVMHTFRLQYRQGKMNVYFDTMEKAYDIDAYFQPGKIGYTKGEFSEIGFTAFSNVARGSSDNKFYNDTVSLANGYDEKLSYLTKGSELVATTGERGENTAATNLKIVNKNDRATYRMNARETGAYNLNMRVANSMLGATIGVRIDDGEIQEITLPQDGVKFENGDIELNLDTIKLTAGLHNISIYNVGDEVLFNELSYEAISVGEGFDVAFTSMASIDNFIKRNVTNVYQSDGITIDNQNACGVLTQDTYFDSTYELTMTYNSIQPSGYAGIIFNVTNYAGKNTPGDSDGGDNPRAYQGYYFALINGKATLVYNDYNFQTTILSKTTNISPGSLVVLKVVQKNYVYECYLDDQLLFTSGHNTGNLSGQVGAFGSNADVNFHNLIVSHN